MIRRWAKKLKESLWLTPAVISLLSFALALVVGILDSEIYISLSDHLPPIMLTSVELSRTILGVIAGALITMTVFTFSTTMVVLTTYSSQFSPRVVKNFLMDENTMKTLGIFMGGFIYSIMTLAYMRNGVGGNTVIAAMIGILYILFCLIHFLKYINHVSSYIQMNNLIDRLLKEAMEEIGDYKIFLKKGIIEQSLSILKKLPTRDISVNKNGYIQYIDYDKLIRISKDHGVHIVVNKIPGIFITESTPVISIFAQGEIIKDQTIDDELRACFDVGKEHAQKQDFVYPIQKISEIAVRAISPGINDPNTAIHCLHIMGTLLAEAASIEKGYLVIAKEEKILGAFEVVDFAQVLYHCFYQIIHYGKEDISVMVGLLRALRIVQESASVDNKELLKEFIDFLWEKINPEGKVDFERRWLENERNKLNHKSSPEK
jgi:uncharacterized membrane protein